MYFFNLDIETLFGTFDNITGYL